MTDNDSRLFNSIYIHTQPKTVDLVKTNTLDPIRESLELKFKEYAITRPDGKVVHCKTLIKIKNISTYEDKLEKYFKKQFKDLWQRPDTLCNSCDKVHNNSWKWVDEIYGVYHFKTKGNKNNFKADKITYPKGREWNEERNIRIEDIRAKYMVKTQTGRRRNQGLPWVYKSEEHRQQFLREIEELGLVRNSLEIESEKEKDAVKYTFDNSGNPVEITSSDWIKDPDNNADLKYSLEDLDTYEKEETEN